MKEATGEVSGTVITIVLIAAVLGVAGYFFAARGENGESVMSNWIESLFNKQTESYK